MQGGSGWLFLPLRITPCFLVFKVWVMLNVLVTLGQENGVDKAQYPAKLIKENYIYGNTNHKVDVYVKIHQNSPFLLCMDLALWQSEVIEPHYLWIGPDGQNLREKNDVNDTETGKLMLLNFRESMSGSYTCTLSYRALRADMQAELEKFKTYKFMVYAYREPEYAYRISVHFTTKDCSLAANKKFFKELMRVLNNMIAYITCHILQPSFRCYSVKRPQQSLHDELFIIFQALYLFTKNIRFFHGEYDTHTPHTTAMDCNSTVMFASGQNPSGHFAVNPFGPGWKTACRLLTDDCEDVTNSRIQKARWLIEEFFNKQQYILTQEFENVPAIHYVDRSFQVTRLDSCHPGFGKNNLIHNDCANCCVACDPGTYSSNNDVFCRPCTNIRIKQYGATSC